MSTDEPANQGEEHPQYGQSQYGSQMQWSLPTFRPAAAPTFDQSYTTHPSNPVVSNEPQDSNTSVYPLAPLLSSHQNYENSYEQPMVPDLSSLWGPAGQSTFPANPQSMYLYHIPQFDDVGHPTPLQQFNSPNIANRTCHPQSLGETHGIREPNDVPSIDFQQSPSQPPSSTVSRQHRNFKPGEKPPTLPRDRLTQALWLEKACPKPEDGVKPSGKSCLTCLEQGRRCKGTTISSERKCETCQGGPSKRKRRCYWQDLVNNITTYNEARSYDSTARRLPHNTRAGRARRASSAEVIVDQPIHLTQDHQARDSYGLSTRHTQFSPAGYGPNSAIPIERHASSITIDRSWIDPALIDPTLTWPSSALSDDHDNINHEQ